MKRKFLMTPGPSPVPSFVRESLSREIMHHRTSEFQEILKDVHNGLKKIFCTENPVLILASSGTGAMEAAVANLFSRGNKVISTCGGKFGERWTNIAKSFSLEVIEMNTQWGTSPSLKELNAILEKDNNIKGVLTTLCETSTATVFDIKEIAKVTKQKGVLLLVDAISGLGQDKLLSDEWGVDVVVSSSQKGLMLPPGLSFISLNNKAQEALKNSDLPKFYFDLKKALKSYGENDTPFTPAVSLVVALKDAVDAINAEGLNTRWSKFEKMAYAAQEGLRALGLEIYSKSPSASVTAAFSPQGVKASDLVKKLRKDYGLSIAAGQGDIKDKIFRIAHMGWINEQDLIMCFSLLEKAFKDLGYKFKVGASLSRLEEVFYD
ncbi:MAG: alanine--glyoxylate aminotransferase family protein [Candidatus Omnitrophica bacterium]|jgi:aspartate aminotransferase-like enzyme|nr:alanine--glyoxylate aminotransferase family protein [Candidatus Omnitrophota bacterium]